MNSMQAHVDTQVNFALEGVILVTDCQGKHESWDKGEGECDPTERLKWVQLEVQSAAPKEGTFAYNMSMGQEHMPHKHMPHILPPPLPFPPQPLFCFSCISSYPSILVSLFIVCPCVQWLQ